VKIVSRGKGVVLEIETFKCAAALSLSVKTPVDSTTISAPVSPHGISSGFLRINKRFNGIVCEETNTYKINMHGKTMEQIKKL